MPTGVKYKDDGLPRARARQLMVKGFESLRYEASRPLVLDPFRRGASPKIEVARLERIFVLGSAGSSMALVPKARGKRPSSRPAP